MADIPDIDLYADDLGDDFQGVRLGFLLYLYVDFYFWFVWFSFVCCWFFFPSPPLTSPVVDVFAVPSPSVCCAAGLGE